MIEAGGRNPGSPVDYEWLKAELNMELALLYAIDRIRRQSR